MATTRIKLRAQRAKLGACLLRTNYPQPVREIAGSIISGLGAAEISARIHPVTKARLLEDLDKLEAIIKAR